MPTLMAATESSRGSSLILPWSRSRATLSAKATKPAVTARPPPHPPQIRHPSGRSAEEPLDLGGAAAHAPRRDLPGSARGRGAGEQSVFGGNPPLTRVLEKLGNALLHRGGAQDPGLPDFAQGRPLGVLEIAPGDRDRTYLLIFTAARPHLSHPLKGVAGPEGTPGVDVPGQRQDFGPLHGDLDLLDFPKFDGEGIHEELNGQELTAGPPRMFCLEIAREVHVCGPAA